jgi:hypothetical protein
MSLSSIVRVSLFIIGSTSLFAVASCGGDEDEKKDFSGVIGSCTQTKSANIDVEADGETSTEEYEYKRCDDMSYSGKLKEDPKEGVQAQKKELCEVVSEGKFSTTTCSRAKVSADCGSDEQTSDTENGTVTITSQDFIYEPAEGWPEGYDVKKELCK